jgi:hypothetical protein
MPECRAAWVSDDIRAMTPADPALRARRWSCPAGRPGSSSGAGARGGAGNARHLLPRGSSPHDAAAGPGRSHADRCAASPPEVTAGLAAGYPRDGDLSAIWRKRRLSRSTAASGGQAASSVCKAAPYWPRARLAGSVLLGARLSWPSPSSQGQAAARSLREPGHGGHGQRRAATRSTGETPRSSGRRWPGWLTLPGAAALESRDSSALLPRAATFVVRSGRWPGAPRGTGQPSTAENPGRLPRPLRKMPEGSSAVPQAGTVPGIAPAGRRTARPEPSCERAGTSRPRPRAGPRPREPCVP